MQLTSQRKRQVVFRAAASFYRRIAQRRGSTFFWLRSSAESPSVRLFAIAPLLLSILLPPTPRAKGRRMHVPLEKVTNDGPRCVCVTPTTMASSHVTVPLPMRLGTHVIARMSGPALILGNVGISARTATPPETLRSLAGPPLLASTRVATFDVGLPGVYLLEVIAIYTEPYDPLVPNRTQCTAGPWIPPSSG